MTIGSRRFDRLRRNGTLIRSMLSLHPRSFVFSFVGAAVFAIATVASSFAIRWVIDNVILPRFEDGEVAVGTFFVGAGMIIGIGLVRAVGVVFRRAFASAGMWRVAESYTNQVLDRLVRQPVSWHRRHPDGDLVARAGVDTETTVSVIAPIPFATSTVLMIVISTIWLFIIDIPLGIVAVVVFPLVIATNVVYERSVSQHYTRAQEQLGDFSAAVHESFEGVQLVKAYGAEERETVRLAELADRVRASRVEAIERRSWFDALTDMIPAIANIVLVLLGAARVESGDVTIGQFSSVIFLFTLLVLPLRLIGYALSELPRSMAAWIRIQAVVTEVVLDDPTLAIGTPDAGLGIQLTDVGFTHEESDLPSLHGIDLALPLGTITALVGPTGSGKSTLTDVVVGLVPATSGAVALAPGARSIVFQEAFLIAGTVRDNVVFGNHADDDDVWAALHLAAADDFVRALPSGLDTVVGERGVSLSGGQRQRVALAWGARAAPLDPGPGRHDLGARPGDRGGDPRPVAIVPRVDGVDDRVAAVDDRGLADVVVFMSAGRVAAHGTHDELLEREPGYREIVEAFEADRAGAW